MDYYVYKRKVHIEETYSKDTPMYVTKDNKYIPMEWERSWPWRERRIESNVFIFDCKNCGGKIWGEWEIAGFHQRLFAKGLKTLDEHLETHPTDTDSRIHEFVNNCRNEAQEFIRLTTCPICGSELHSDNLHYWGNADISDWDMYNAYSMGYADDAPADPEDDKALNEQSSERGDEKIKDYIQKCESVDMPAHSYTIQTPEQLKAFLGQLVSVEKNIYVVSERLKELYKKEYANNLAASNSVCKIYLDKKQAVEGLLRKLEAKRIEDPARFVKLTMAEQSYPQKPIQPSAPHAPVLEKPGLFNKKRVLSENAARTEKYEKEYANYEEALKQYNEELSIYNKKLEQIKVEQERQHLELVERAMIAHKEECDKLEHEYQAAQREYALSVSEIITPELWIARKQKEEISQAEELLIKLYQTRNQMYLSGVIFKKYNDFVAIASFYEYLSSGRCTSLEGPHGAYNLYESEIRMNAIVSQLADVIKSLNQIQKNQFVIYTAINEATKELTSLNLATQKTNATLNAMHGELATISQNTEVTAFYAKKNAELMDTLCFLTALN